MERHDLQKAVDDVIRADALGLGRVVGQDPVAEHGARHTLDVLERHVEATTDDRARLGAEDQVLPGPRAGDMETDDLRASVTQAPAPEKRD